MSNSFRDKVVQHSLCDNALEILLRKNFLYDNYASQVGKGTDFGLKRLDGFMHKFYRQHGLEGWVLKCDIRKYFYSIPHEYLKRILEPYVPEEDVRWLLWYIIDSTSNPGTPIGNQSSQLLAVLCLSPLDHFIKEKFRIEGGVPAIVDKDTFAIVQKKLSKNAEAPSRGKAKIDYLLSQKLFCGHCGSLMTGESGTGKGGTTYFYYTCGKRKREHTCDKKPLKKDFIERAVVEDALTLLTPETIDELADIAVNESIREMEENSIIPALKDQLHDTERSINNLVKMVEKGVESDTIADRLKELEKEKRAIEKRLVVAQDDYVLLEKDHIVWWLSEFCNGDIEDEEFRRHIIDLLVNSVTVWDEPDGWYKITSVYNLTSNKTKTFRCSDLSGQAPPENALMKYHRGAFFICFENAACGETGGV